MRLKIKGRLNLEIPKEFCNRKKNIVEDFGIFKINQSTVLRM